MKKRKIRNLILGSEGFVGRPLCEFLEKRGEQVVRFDIKRSRREDARCAELPLKNIDRVYFLAWDVGGAKYLYRKNTQLFQLNWNINLLNNVMSQLERSRTPFVFVSTQLAEKAETIYGTLKRVGEFWTKEIGGSCVRLWNPYGAREELCEKSHVVADFINQALGMGVIKMMTTGKEDRQFTYMDDICAGLHYVMKRNLCDKVYDLTDYHWVSIIKIAKMIAGYTGAKVILGKKKGIKRSEAKTVGLPPGWRPKIALEEGLRKMVRKIEKDMRKVKTNNKHHDAGKNLH